MQQNLTHFQKETPIVPTPEKPEVPEETPIEVPPRVPAPPKKDPTPSNPPVEEPEVPKMEFSTLITG